MMSFGKKGEDKCQIFSEKEGSDLIHYFNLNDNDGGKRGLDFVAWSSHSINSSIFEEEKRNKIWLKKFLLYCSLLH